MPHSLVPVSTRLDPPCDGWTFVLENWQGRLLFVTRANIVVEMKYIFDQVLRKQLHIYVSFISACMLIRRQGGGQKQLQFQED